MERGVSNGEMEGIKGYKEVETARSVLSSNQPQPASVQTIANQPSSPVCAVRNSGSGTKEGWSMPEIAWQHVDLPPAHSSPSYISMQHTPKRLDIYDAISHLVGPTGAASLLLLCAHSLHSFNASCTPEAMRCRRLGGITGHRDATELTFDRVAEANLTGAF